MKGQFQFSYSGDILNSARCKANIITSAHLDGVGSGIFTIHSHEELRA